MAMVIRSLVVEIAIKTVMGWLLIIKQIILNMVMKTIGVPNKNYQYVNMMDSNSTYNKKKNKKH